MTTPNETVTPPPGTPPVTPTTNTTATPPAAPPDTGPDDREDELAKWKAMARKHESAAKANADAAKRLAVIEEASKTNEERLAAQLKESSDRLARYELRDLRTAAAETAGLPVKWAARMTATTEAEAKAEAKQLKDDLDELTGGTAGPANLRQGARTTARPPETPDDLIRRMAGFQ